MSIFKAPPKESCNGDLLGYIVTWSEQSSSTSGVNQSKSLNVNGWATNKVQLTGLRNFTKYDITIRAFNSIASGPASNPITGTTQEGGKILKNLIIFKSMSIMKQIFLFIFTLCIKSI